MFGQQLGLWRAAQRLQQVLPPGWARAGLRAGLASTAGGEGSTQSVLSWPPPESVLADNVELRGFVAAEAWASRQPAEPKPQSRQRAGPPAVSASTQQGALASLTSPAAQEHPGIDSARAGRQWQGGAGAEVQPGGGPGYSHASPLTAEEVADLLTEMHTDDVTLLDVRGRCPFAEHFVVATARSTQHAHAAASAVVWRLKQHWREAAAGVAPQLEGGPDSDWLVVDAGSVVVHVMLDSARVEYNLEQLWAPEPARRHTRLSVQPITLHTITA